MSLGTYNLHKTSLDREANALITLDFGQRHEIVAGATISSASARIMLGNSASSDITCTSATVDGTGKKVQTRISDAAAVVNSSYLLVVNATISDTTVLIETVTIFVQLA